MVGDQHRQHDGRPNNKNSAGNCPQTGKEDWVPRHVGDGCWLEKGDGPSTTNGDHHSHHDKSPSRDGGMKCAMRNAKVCVSWCQVASCTESIEDNTALCVIVGA